MRSPAIVQPPGGNGHPVPATEREAGAGDPDRASRPRAAPPGPPGRQATWSAREPGWSRARAAASPEVAQITATSVSPA